MKNMLAALVVVLFGIGSAVAGGHAMLTGDQIQQQISGNTVQGSMADGSRYTEFYATDGTIRGNGYTGNWRVQANQMCFKYGDDPEYCLSIELVGDQVYWIAGGKKEGTGTLVTGNPNEY